MRILLLGASGFVGGVLWSHLSGRHEVVAVARSGRVPGAVRVDLCDDTALTALARDRFDLVVNAAGLVDRAACERDRERAWALNVRPLWTLMHATGAKIVQLSTDNVFDGEVPVCTEPSPTAPVNVYGESKVAAENVVLRDDRHLVLRIPMVFGTSPFSRQFLDRFARARTPAPTDVVCAPVYLPSLAADFERLCELTGIVHYGGEQVVTRYELMTRVGAALGLPTRVVPVREVDLGLDCRRPRHVVLRSVRHPMAGTAVDAAVLDLARGCR